MCLGSSDVDGLCVLALSFSSFDHFKCDFFILNLLILVTLFVLVLVRFSIIWLVTTDKLVLCLEEWIFFSENVDKWSNDDLGAVSNCVKVDVFRAQSFNGS